METKTYLAELYPKLLNKSITDAELDWLIAYFESDDRTELILMIREALMISDEVVAAKEHERIVLDRVLVALENKINAETRSGKPRVVSLSWIKIAAAVFAVAVIGAGLFFYSKQNLKDNVEIASVQNDVAPGKVGATLTLSSGKQIKLSDAVNGRLAEEAGVEVSKSADGELVYEVKNESGAEHRINTLSTAKGETYQVRLPDGSMVWLNAASSLTYAANLKDSRKRTVKLSGEGYFEIAKDVLRPFVVESEGQTVEVLGTHFNINTYSDEPETKTTLLEGSIRLNGKLTLLPGTQAVMDQNHIIAVKEVNTVKTIAWKNGKFVFTSEPLESIMRKLARWYNVEVVYEGGVGDMPFTGSMSRADNISKILDKITLTQTVHFKIEGRRVTVTK